MQVSYLIMIVVSNILFVCLCLYHKWLCFYTAALQSLRQHWQNDLEFSLTLLNQFLEDMEAYAEVRMQMQPV